MAILKTSPDAIQEGEFHQIASRIDWDRLNLVVFPHAVLEDETAQ